MIKKRKPETGAKYREYTSQQTGDRTDFPPSGLSNAEVQRQGFAIHNKFKKNVKLNPREQSILKRYLMAKKKKILEEKIKIEQKRLRNEELIKTDEQGNKILYFGHEGKGYLGEHGTWEPNKPQRTLIDRINQGMERIFTLTGANQIGKTAFEVFLALAVIQGCWPWEDKKIVGTHLWETYNWKPPIYVRWIGGGWEEHIQKNLIEQGLKDLWPDSWDKTTKKNNMGVDYLWNHIETGSQINFMSHNQKRKAFAGWKGHCIEGSQRVFMYDRTLKPIKDIVVGDLVWTTSDKSGYRSLGKVCATANMGEQEVFELTIKKRGYRKSKRKTLVCTSDHKIMSRDGWKMAKDLKRSDLVKVPYFKYRDMKKISIASQYYEFVSLEPIGISEVYDIQIGKWKSNHVVNSNFICEGIKVSNCTIFDEPFPAEIWAETMRGMIAKGGLCFIGASLVEENQSWIEDEIISKEDLKVYQYTAKMYENVGHGLTQKNMDEFASLLSPEERLVRLEGQSAGKRSKVLKLKDEHWLDKTIKDIPLDFLIDISIDYHPNKQQYINFLATGPYSIKYLCHEIVSDYGKSAGAKWLVNEIVRAKMTYTLRINRVIIDPLSKGNQNAIESDSETVFSKVSEGLAAYGIELETASKHKEDGIIEINSLLNPKEGKPSLYIYSLPIAKKQLNKWRYDEVGKASKSDDDTCENLYRLVNLETEYRPIYDDYEQEEYEDGGSTRNTYGGY